MITRFRTSIFLMVVTILVISAFQLYWLHKNYLEEQHLFRARTNILFRETIMRLQASKLHLDSNINIRVQDKEGIINMTNILQERIRDSSGPRKNINAAMVITLDHSNPDPQPDSNMQFHLRNGQPGGPVFDFLMGIDSLRDSITIKEINDRYARALAKEKISLPFVVTVADSASRRQLATAGIEDNTVEVGFTKPRMYKLSFINDGWYILKHMWQPVLISFLLVGITIASFLLMYRNLRRQQRLTQLKNDFISNITHELKTPIATVSVAIEALKNFNALQNPQLTAEYLEISGGEMQRLGLLVDKVLKLSLYESKGVTLTKESFSLVTLAQEVIASMKLQFNKQHGSVTIITSGENFVVEADRLHLSSVLYNLLDNALKYSKEAPVIKLEIKDCKSYIEVNVIDNGIGIAPEYTHKVFEQFFRVPGSDRHNIKGYGLGLSYANHIVQRHMGFFEVKSTLGQGSIFSIKLPFIAAPVIHYDNGRKIVKEAFKVGKS